MKTKDMIESLSLDLKPAKVIKFNFTHFLKVVIVGLLSLVAAVAILGLRADLYEQMLNVRFFIESVWLLILALVSIFSALRLSIPDVNNKKYYKWPAIAFSMLGISTLYSFLSYSNPFLYLKHGFVCIFEILLIGVFPAAVLFYFIRRAAALKRDIVGVLVLMSGTAFGWLGTQLTCSDSTPLHNLFWHFLPFAVISLSGIYLSKKLLKSI